MIGGIFNALARPNRIAGLPLFAPLCALLLLAQLPSALGMVVTLRVPEDYESIAAAIADAPDHAVIEIAAGAYREALVIGRPLTLRALERAQVTLVAPSDDRSVVAIRDTDAVSIEGLTIVGGEYGIFVTNSRAITIQGNTVLGSRLAGIKVRLGAADILNNSVINAQAPYGFGIHVTNTMQWPESRVTGNIVFGNAHGGIYTNMTSMIHINDNIVRQNGEYGIAVTEMSHADVLGNTVAGTTGIGINVLDMSMALVCDNLVIDTLSDIDSQSIRNGTGITVDYHSEAFLSGNTIAGSALNGLSVLYGSYAYLHENQISDSMEQSVYVDESVVEEGAGCEADH
ncbi:MAG: right-handed parallel beta-helix repeat-containing protein [Chloroflexota bacterium]|nr:right-handed parallel beta-helix repeat-containing protein [Chloroflexota bacterium]